MSCPVVVPCVPGQPQREGGSLGPSRRLHEGRGVGRGRGRPGPGESAPMSFPLTPVPWDRVVWIGAGKPGSRGCTVPVRLSNLTGCLACLSAFCVLRPASRSGGALFDCLPWQHRRRRHLPSPASHQPSCLPGPCSSHIPGRHTRDLRERSSFRQGRWGTNGGRGGLVLPIRSRLPPAAARNGCQIRYIVSRDNGGRQQTRSVRWRVSVGAQAWRLPLS